MSVAQKADLIVVADIVRYVGKLRTQHRIPESMEVEVREVLIGIESRTRLQVRGDNGKFCRPYVSEFPQGTTWVLALNHARENKSHYAISKCGEYWLPLSGDQVRGYILPDLSQTASMVEVSLDKLRNSLKKLEPDVRD